MTDQEPEEWIPTKSFAERVGLSERGVRNAVSRGHIQRNVKPGGRGQPHRFLWPHARDEMDASTRDYTPRQTGSNGDGEGQASPAGARQLNLEAQREDRWWSAQLRRQQFEQRAGLLVDRAQAEAEAARLAELMVHAVLAIPERCTPIIQAHAGEGADPAAIRATLLRECNAIIRDFAEVIARGAHGMDHQCAQLWECVEGMEWALDDWATWCEWATEARDLAGRIRDTLDDVGYRPDHPGAVGAGEGATPGAQ